MNISIWGQELSARVMSACLAHQGNRVICAENLDGVEVDHEPGLRELMSQTRSRDHLRPARTEECYDSEIHFFCFAADQKHLALELAQQLTLLCPNDFIIVNQSNFGIGATDQLQNLIGNRGAALYMADNLPEGRAIEYIRQLASLTLGSHSSEAIMKIRALMRPFLTDPQRILLMKPHEAEFAKLAVTGMLALRIGYINELANLADQLSVDIESIRSAMMLDSRISPEYLRPGCGFGGLNFSRYIEDLAQTLQEERGVTLMSSVLTQNEIHKDAPFRKLWKYYNGVLADKKVGIWGVSFKPNTASIEHSPSIKIVSALLAQQAQVCISDPQALATFTSRFADSLASQPNFAYEDNKYDALKDADALIILTEWPQYSSPDYDLMKSLMRHAVIIDGRNLLDKNLAEAKGFYYEGMGR